MLCWMTFEDEDLLVCHCWHVFHLLQESSWRNITYSIGARQHGGVSCEYLCTHAVSADSLHVIIPTEMVHPGARREGSCQWQFSARADSFSPQWWMNSSVCEIQMSHRNTRPRPCYFSSEPGDYHFTTANSSLVLQRKRTSIMTMWASPWTSWQWFQFWCIRLFSSLHACIVRCQPNMVAITWRTGPWQLIAIVSLCPVYFNQNHISWPSTCCILITRRNVQIDLRWNTLGKKLRNAGYKNFWVP